MYLSLSQSHSIVIPRPSLPFVPSLVFLEPAGRWRWQKWMGETLQEGRRLWRQVFFWDDHLVPSTDGYTEARGGSLDPWGEAQVREDGISGHTEGSWPNELRGGPRAGLGQSVWVHIEENGGFLGLGNP